MQGILFKRRDVFKNSWRPRFFTVDRGTLTYFILKNEYEYYTNTRQDPPLPSDDSESFTHLIGTLLGPFEDLNSSQSSDPASFNLEDNASTQDDLHSFIHEPQPRGVFKLDGAFVQIEDDTTILAQTKLFAFSITLKISEDMKTNNTSTGSNSSPMKIYLAATTLEDRDMWVADLSKECQMNAVVTETSTVTLKDSKNADEVTSDTIGQGKSQQRVNGTSFVHLISPFSLSSMFGTGIPDHYIYSCTLCYLSPPLIWLLMRHYDVGGKDLVFILLWIFTQRFMILRALGTPIPHVQNHVGPVFFNCTVDLTGVLRYLKLNHEDKSTADTSSQVSVTSIVIKAVACALEKVPGQTIIIIVSSLPFFLMSSRTDVCFSNVFTQK